MSRHRPAPVLPAPGGPLEARLRRARELTARHRRLAAALCAGAAVLAVVSALTPAPADGPPRGAVAGTRPGPGGAPLPPGAGTRPASVAERVAVTVRLADPAGVLLLSPGVHVEVVGGVPAGSGAATGGAADAAVLAADAVVLGVPQAAGAEGGREGGLGGSFGGSSGGALGASSGGAAGLDGVVVLSVRRTDAHRLAGAAGSRPLSVAVSLPGS